MSRRLLSVYSWSICRPYLSIARGMHQLCRPGGVVSRTNIATLKLLPQLPAPQRAPALPICKNSNWLRYYSSNASSRPKDGSKGPADTPSDIKTPADIPKTSLSQPYAPSDQFQDSPKASSHPPVPSMEPTHTSTASSKAPPPNMSTDPSAGASPDQSKATSTQPNKRPLTLDHHLKRVKTKWGRLAVRTKWALIKSYRPFNTDDIGAMFSWIIWGHILWIILGTTTFISLVVWFMSQFRAEDALARWVGRLVTRETGLRVVFEQAIVPDWKSGCIVLNKVFMQRRPGAVRNVATGSQQLAVQNEQNTASNVSHTEPSDDGNYTQFDLTVDTISVTLSVKRWLSGRGILETVEAKGIRGVLDRRHIKKDQPNYDPTLHRRTYKQGGFDWDTVKVEDLMVTILQPNHDPLLPPVPPFQVSLFSCELPRLRKQWLLYDILNANYLSGSFDNAMFSMHTRQIPTEITATPRNRLVSEQETQTISKVQRLRIDDVDIRHLNRGVTGMFGWIESGTCDFLADIMLPPDEAELTTVEKTRDLLERWDAQLQNIWSNNKQNSREMITSVQRDARAREAQKTVAIDLRVQFNNPRATAPLYSRNLNYLNNAIIHPVVAYINSRDTYIPVHCSVVKRLSDFDGSWTVYDSGLMGALSTELYHAFARNAQDDEARSRRIKKVGFWSLQFMAQLVLLTLGIVA